MKTKDLFRPVVNVKKLNMAFDHWRTSLAKEPARIMANEIFQDFHDTDGNFVEQFQTSGFDARVFELYLYAYLSRSGYTINRENAQPDFIVTKGNVTVAIEATTINPTQTQETNNTAKIVDMTKEQFREKLDNELPIRFGSPLFSKLNKEYWQLEHCRVIPIVIAIEAFQEEESLYFSDSSLGQYLYGLRHFPDWTEDGHLVVRSEDVTNHTFGSKTIPSNFFGQPGAEHISAVVFSNSGTYSKFCRMAYQFGYYRGNVDVIRHGTCYDHNPDASEPQIFDYAIDDSPITETWGQGLMVFHNPQALYPLPSDYFKDAGQTYIEDGQVKSYIPDFYPYMSQTLEFHFNRGIFDTVEERKQPIESLLRCEFDELGPARHPTAAVLALEKEWFADKQKIILGTLLRDRPDEDWGFVILGRDQSGVFRWIDGEASIENRDLAREQLVSAMNKILESGKTVFPQ